MKRLFRFSWNLENFRLSDEDSVRIRSREVSENEKKCCELKLIIHHKAKLLGQTKLDLDHKLHESFVTDFNE